MTSHAQGWRWFLPLALCSALAFAAIVGRVALSDTHGYVFLLWNLALAWLPYLLSLGAAGIDRYAPRARLLLLPAVGALWLLFFPNAPYIVTDFIHLGRFRGFAWWYDVGLLAIFAWTGCFLGVASLDVMQGIVRRAAGRVAAWLFVLASALLGGLGVYLGRFHRWNSWDALFAPHDVAAAVLDTLADPGALRQVIGVTGMFAALVVMCYVTFAPSARR